MIILGVDPGSRWTGFGIVKADRQSVIHIENGTLYLVDHEPFTERLRVLHDHLQDLVNRYHVTMFAIENIFYHNNPRSLQKLGEVRGAILLTAALQKIPVAEYSALQVKQAVTGYGKASKEQMQKMVRTLLNLKDLAEENASDALGVALCHAHNVSGLAAGNIPKNEKPGRTRAQELLAKASFYRGR